MSGPWRSGAGAARPEPPLPLFEPPALALGQLLIRSNPTLKGALSLWREWPSGALALAGGGAVLAAEAWAAGLHAACIGPSATIAEAQAALATGGGAAWVADADLGFEDVALSFLIDLARAGQARLLFTARAAPAFWPAQTPDLASRLAAMPVMLLPAPELETVAEALQILARARYLELPPPVARFLSERIERSFAAAQRLIDALDPRVRRASEPITYDAARQALAALAEMGENAAMEEHR